MTDTNINTDTDQKEEENNNVENEEFVDNVESINLDLEKESVNTEEEASLDSDAVDKENQDSHAVLTALQEENAELKDKTLRALAEVENIRRRTEKERTDTAKYSVAKFAREMLSVADNLRRALDAIPEENRETDEQLQNIFVGVEATEKELLRCFESFGIKKIIPVDQPFDANFHEVMFEADVPDKTPGHVIEVLEAGYMIHDRLLRPARVGVAKKPKISESDRIDEEV